LLCSQACQGCTEVNSHHRLISLYHLSEIVLNFLVIVTVLIDEEGLHVFFVEPNKTTTTFGTTAFLYFRLFSIMGITVTMAVLVIIVSVSVGLMSVGVLEDFTLRSLNLIF